MNKEELENMLYNEELDLERLLELKDKMKSFDFSDSDFEYADELILEKIDLLDNVEEIKELKNKYSNYDTSLFDKIINRRELLKNKEIEKMSREELKYIYENEELDLIDLFRLYTCMKKNNFKKEDLNYVIELIKDEIDVIEYKDYHDLLDKLDNIKINCYKYKCDVSILNKYIDYVKKKTKSGISIGKILFWTAIGAIGNNKTNDSSLMSWEEDTIKNNGYESYNFEEEELEEDDYYYEDDKD